MTTKTAKAEPSYTVLAVCATVVALALIAGLVVLVLFAPPDTDLVKILGAAGTGLALAVGQVANYLKTRNVAVVATDTAGKVDDLTNGLLDAKIRSGVADVLPDHLIDPEAHDQLKDDRVRRDVAAAKHADPAPSA